MKTLFLFIVLCAVSLAARAQDADPLAVTLPNGKIVHFQSPEQKEKFEAAQRRKEQMSAVAAATATPAPTATRATLGSALDAPASSTSGIVNTSAPPFTASYYLLAPATWVGKKVTLAVAYVDVRNEADRADGLVQMSASTWNSSATVGGDQDHGGWITILATPAAASRIVQQCGTSLQYSNGYRVKVTMIHGEISVMETVKGENRGSKKYGFRVDS